YCLSMIVPSPSCRRVTAAESSDTTDPSARVSEALLVPGNASRVMVFTNCFSGSRVTGEVEKRTMAAILPATTTAAATYYQCRELPVACIAPTGVFPCAAIALQASSFRRSQSASSGIVSFFHSKELYHCSSHNFSSSVHAPLLYLYMSCSR